MPSLPVCDQVIRNFELMGRVNLDQLELIKDRESSCEEEDGGDMMEMVGDESVARTEDEEDEEDEEEEEEEEEQEVMASIQGEKEMDEEEMEGMKEEEEEQEMHIKDEAAGERHPLQGRTAVNKVIYSTLDLTDCANSISQKPSLPPSAAREQAARRSASPASSVAAASPTAWSGNVTSCATACESLCTRLSALFLVFAQTRGAVESLFVEGFQALVCSHAYCSVSP